MHSPWGWLGAMSEKTGWTLHYLLWKVSRANLMAMIADKPDIKYPGESSKDTPIKKTDPNELFNLIRP